jgi:hypothetical protein
MKVKFKRMKGSISLVIDDLGNNYESVLAAMVHLEGTPCWRLVDLRLSRQKRASLYSGTCNADDFQSSIKLVDEHMRAKVAALLREYSVIGDEIVWCTFDGIVRGKPEVSGYKPKWKNFDQAGWWSYKDAFDYLRKAKEFWSSFDGDCNSVKLDNPYLQPNIIEINFNLGGLKLRRLRGNGKVL